MGLSKGTFKFECGTFGKKPADLALAFRLIGKKADDLGKVVFVHRFIILYKSCCISLIQQKTAKVKGFRTKRQIETKVVIFRQDPTRRRGA